MRTTRWFGLALLASVAVFSTRMTAAKPVSDIPVVTEIENSPTLGSPFLAFQAQSDSLGNYVNGVSGVTSVITEEPGLTHRAGDFYMNTGTQKRSPRLLYLNVNANLVPQTGSLHNNAPVTAGSTTFPAALYAGTLKANCDLNDVDLRSTPAVTNGAPTVVQCGFGFEFTANGQIYDLRMNPGITTTGAVQFPETDYANFTCTSAPTGNCTAWRIDPSGTAVENGTTVLANIARLTLGNGSIPIQNMGDYYLSFEVTFHQ